ncbi:MAG TPA: MFS transporter [Treponemataceae bacterium]|nr:MFS transporter [Treponemataceae bacterium]HPS44347.1 MFS transporter [Treponemataceae bacterium]
MNLSFGKKCVYALGQFGLVLSAYGAGKLFVSFFVDTGISHSGEFPLYIDSRYYFGFFTVVGLIVALNRIVDLAGGLLSGWLSDRSRMQKGRRTGFMLMAALPLAVFSVLVFFPPVAAVSPANAVFVLICMVCFFSALAMYTTPYLALISEFGVTPRQRMQLSMLTAFASSLAYLLGNRVSFFMNAFGADLGLSSVMSFRLVIGLYGLVAGVCLALPPLLIDERRYSQSEAVTDGFQESIAIVLKDTYFRSYLISDLMYRIAAAFIMTGFTFYVTLLLGQRQDTAALYLLIIFFVNLALYYPISVVVDHLGKRKVLFAAFLMFMLFLVFSAFAGRYPLDPFAQGLILCILVSIPLSVFTVVPFALVADLAVASERKTGIQRGGTYFGVHSLVVKAGELIPALFFPVAVMMGSAGKGVPGRAGLRLTLILAAVFSLIGFLSLFGYREREIASLFEREE